MTEPVRTLESHVAGAWVRGTGAETVLGDASTGAPVAVVAANGAISRDALDHARDVGGPALRSMSLHDRALMVKALATHLMARKETLYALSTLTGATRTDGWIDIEGGIGTLFAYASRVRRDLPNTAVLVDGPVEPLSRDGSFTAQHILTPREGVAVHINAYNFPVWGMLEKLAPCLIAGVPAVIKPATPTAWLAEACYREMLDAGVLPPGAVQMIVGPARDLLDGLGPQDLVSFTGSAATGRLLRAHPSVIEHAVRFTMEADSLNAAILGPDAKPETPEFDLFVAEVMREVTVKAGQKCTAIRRAMVPASLAEPVLSALSDRLGAITIGHPAAEGVSMGPLAGIAQRNDLEARLAILTAETETVLGGPADPVDADADKGAFVTPHLLWTPKPHRTAAVHSTEAFGPVVTVMPYDTLDDAADLVAAGQGALVASLFTADAAVAAGTVARLAPWHGRVMISNRDSAKTATGHGSPLPHLLHGGPGRAGDGAELGGLEAVRHHMQRTAVQGPPAMLSAVTGRWYSGAPTREDVHPFRKSLADLAIGDCVVTTERTITLEDIETFAHMTGDVFYAHMDEVAARANPFFDGRVAHGYLILSFAAGLFVDPDPGPVLANYGIDSLRFLAPAYPGDSLRACLTAKEINPRAEGAHGEVRWDCAVTNGDGKVVAQYDVLTMVAKTWPLPAG